MGKSLDLLHDRQAGSKYHRRHRPIIIIITHPDILQVVVPILVPRKLLDGNRRKITLENGDILHSRSQVL